MRRAARLAALAVALAAATAACTTQATPQPAPTGPVSPPESTYLRDEVAVVHVVVDGRTVPCVVWNGYREGGLSCDWSADGKTAKPE